VVLDQGVNAVTPRELVNFCEQTVVNFDAEVAEFDFSVQPLFRQWLTEAKYYSMLAAYTKLVGVQHALDLGCSAGLSALAMAKHAKQVTTVDTSFDVVFDVSIFTRRPINKWLVTGAEKPSSFDFSPYDMIFVDVGNHDGTYERDLHQKLLETWTGFAFYDDINFPGLTALWYDITVPKATTDWHHSGFGVVQYGYKGE
jgi:predicted O-methyltransferase YrrM